MEKTNSGKLDPQEIGKTIGSRLLDKFFNCFSYAEEDAIWWSFRINDLIGKGIRKKQIWIKKEYTLFTDIMSRPETEKIVYLKIVNLEKNNKDKKKAF